MMDKMKAIIATIKRLVGSPRRVMILSFVGLVLVALFVGATTLAGEDFSRREVPEVERGRELFAEEDFDRAVKLFEEGRTDLADQEGALWLDRGLALARMGKNDEAALALRRAAGSAKAGHEVRSEAHYSLGNLAMSQHRDFEALEELRQALRLWPENRDAAWNLSMARRRLEIDACRIVEPATLRVVSGQESDEIIGEVVEHPRTGEEGPMEGLRAQLGVGPNGSNPARDDGWQWKNAEYAGESQEGGGERYAIKIKAGDPGRYDYAFRFRQPGGDWQHCDLDGSNVGGYSPEQAGELWVEPPGDRCILLGPAWLITAPAAPSDPVEVALAISEEHELGEVQLGHGPDGADPGEETWSWSAATAIDPLVEANGSIPAGSPRYHGRLVIDGAGRYDYAFRFRPRGQDQWIHCDLNGSDDGYNPQGAGDVIVRELPESGCLLDRPPRTQAAPGGPTEPIRALVRPPEGALINDDSTTIEIGHGADGSNPGEEGWTWLAAERLEADEAEDIPQGWTAYAVSMTAPESEGAFDYAVRMRSGGETSEWVVCDLDGSLNGYEPAMAGELIVQDSQSDSQDDQDDQDEQDEEDEEDDEDDQDDQEDQDDQDEDEQDEEEQLPQDMESVLDALQQNEQTFLPPSTSRQVRNDW